ncbi:helix-turn-helix domain-containing protein [Streptomyces rishiriensis]|uniref:helix-turn-helix domain-containing protein n=1 Tax=Streptomyces rishiriensis TaxID=68264 RepID=UPI0033C7F3EA
MYDVSTRKRAVALIAQGRSLNSVSRETGISRAAIRSWRGRLEPLPRMAAPLPGPPTDRMAYSWPGLIDACEAALLAVNPAHTAYRVQAAGHVSVVGCYAHWPDLLPQHGPGRKPERRIPLEPWQQAIVDEHPWQFIRGLIHSDGCRIANWTEKTIGGARKRYAYPRYFFTNLSDDIRGLYTDTLDKLGVDWTYCTRNGIPFNISVARKASVALMDAHVGPKH